MWQWKSAQEKYHCHCRWYCAPCVFTLVTPQQNACCMWLNCCEWWHVSVALAYVTTGEYPELLRLRIQMLMESGCEGYSLNLISWCVRSPVFESDVAMRATYLLLLHRLGRTDDFHNQVYHFATSRSFCRCVSSISVNTVCFNKNSQQTSCCYFYCCYSFQLLFNWCVFFRRFLQFTPVSRFILTRLN